MEDFASAAILRLIQVGLARQGLSAPVPRDAKGPHVPLSSKRDLLRDIESHGGALALLRIGEAIDHMPKDPTLVALGAARSPGDLMGRWQRLARFVHSRHRTEVMDQSEGLLVVRHVSQVDGEAPSRSEDLLILGVLVGLMRWIGASELSAGTRLNDPCYFDGVWQRPPQGDKTDTWHFTWGGQGQSPSPDVQEAGLLGRLQELIAGDPACRWTLGLAAASLGTSTRSLQRRLGEEGASFSRLLREVRATEAAEMLQNTIHPLSQIGFLCGYSDHAHFTRSFKDAVGVAPRQYRRAFLG